MSNPLKILSHPTLFDNSSPIKRQAFLPSLCKEVGISTEQKLDFVVQTKQKLVSKRIPKRKEVSQRFSDHGLPFKEKGLPFKEKGVLEHFLGHDLTVNLERNIA